MIKIVIKISDKFIVTRYSSGVNDDLLYIVVYMRENIQEFLVIYTFFLEITESLWYDARAQRLCEKRKLTKGDKGRK